MIVDPNAGLNEVHGDLVKFSSKGTSPVGAWA